jgi:hypothetical protein
VFFHGTDIHLWRFVSGPYSIRAVCQVVAVLSSYV